MQRERDLSALSSGDKGFANLPFCEERRSLDIIPVLLGKWVSSASYYSIMSTSKYDSYKKSTRFFFIINNIIQTHFTYMK